MTTGVLLTATVAPEHQILMLHLRDPDVRLHQYLSAIKAWRAMLAGSDTELVVLENSQSLDPLTTGVLVRSCEPIRGFATASFHRFPGPPTHDKGTGETLLLDAAVHAGLIDKFSLVVKCTGRLVVRNYFQAYPVGSASPSPERVQVLLNSTLRSADSRTWATTPVLWKEHFTGMANDISGARVIEQVLALRTLAALGSGVEFLRFPELPDYQGHSGAHGTDYGSVTTRGKRMLHAQLRRTLARAHWTL